MLNIPYIYRHAQFSAENVLLNLKALRDEAANALKQSVTEFNWRAGDKEVKRLLDWPDRGSEAEGHFSFNKYLSQIEGDLERGSSGVFRCAGRSSRTAFHLIRRLADDTYMAFGFFHSQAMSIATLKRNRRKFAVYFDNIEPILQDDLDAIIAQTKLDARNAARFVRPSLPIDAAKGRPPPIKCKGEPDQQLLSGLEVDFLIQLLCTDYHVQLAPHETIFLRDCLETTTPDDCIDGLQAFNRLMAILVASEGTLDAIEYLDLVLNEREWIVRRKGYPEKVSFSKRPTWILFRTLVEAGISGRHKGLLMKDLRIEEKTENYLRNLQGEVNELVQKTIRVQIRPTGDGVWKLVCLDRAT